MRAVKRDGIGIKQDAPPTWSDLIDRMFGRLIAIGYTGAKNKHNAKLITCQCSCGNYVDVTPSAIRDGRTQSCGCLHSEVAVAENIKRSTHGASRGSKLSTLYRAWLQIKQRCRNKKHVSYKSYGARGIDIYDDWATSFTAFENYITSTIGPRPSRTYSLDRINNDDGYVPGNLRWATPAMQNTNKRNTQLFDFNGMSLPLSEWARLANISYSVVRHRVYDYQWPLDEALGTPPGFGRCPLEERRKWIPEK